ncbi:MAG TPA: HEAT repeat domain-containing protein, partial [Anaerolineales bacterium]
ASPDPEWVTTALAAMGPSADETWAEPVILSLEHPSPDIRQVAARAAGELELDDAVEQLKEMLDDPDDLVRLAAVWSLSQIGGEGVRDILEQLEEMTEDEDDLDFIESALENLTFTEELESFALIDVDPEDLNGDDYEDEHDEVDEVNTLDDEADEG